MDFLMGSMRLHGGRDEGTTDALPLSAAARLGVRLNHALDM